MRAPDLYWSRQLKDWDVLAIGKTGIPVMARPLGFEGFALRRRFTLAWRVFTGRYDAVRWTELP